MDQFRKLCTELYTRLLHCISKIDAIKAALILLALIGSTVGTIVGFFVARASWVPPEPMEWVEDISFRIPVLQLESYSATQMTLRTDALGTRIIMGDQILSAPPNTQFRLVLDPMLRQASTGSTLTEKGANSVNAPCPFVAGSTGKYVYPEDDARAKRLKTKRCFTTIEEAKSAGLLIPEK